MGGVHTLRLATIAALISGCTGLDTGSHRAASSVCPSDTTGCPDGGAKEDDAGPKEDDAGPPRVTVPCRVTGGGQIEEGDRPDSFGGNAQPVRGTVRGQWQHITHDPEDGFNFHGQPDSIECFTVAGDPADPPPAPANAALFSGTGRFDGESNCTFEVYVEDHGEPGRDDFYAIDISCPSSTTYSASGELIRGNIQIHAVPPGHL